MANETILVVDADTKSQKVLEVSFKKAGYRVLITDTIEEARRAIEANDPDLIVSDTQLPDGDGFAFCSELKDDPKTGSIPFVFLTEQRSLPEKMRGFELGADEYLTKPIYIKEVTSRVEVLLQKRAQDRLHTGEAEEFEGNLADVTMIDLLQTIERELRSGSIQINRNGRTGAIYFREGNILDAMCGKLQGEEALYRLMLWPDGKFRVEYHENVRRADHIEKNSSELLLEGIRRLDKWNELVGTLPSLGRVFEADYQRLPDLLEELPEEAGRVVRLFDGMRSLREVIDDSPFDDITTLQIIRRLLGEDVLLELASSPDTTTESQSNLEAWLSGAEESDDVPTPFSQVDSSVEITPVGARDEAAKADQKGDGGGHWKVHWDEGEQGPKQAERDTLEEPRGPEDPMSELEAREARRREEEAKHLLRQSGRFEATIPQIKAVRDEALAEEEADEADQSDRAESARRTTTPIETVERDEAGADEPDELYRQRRPTPIATPRSARNAEPERAPADQTSPGIQVARLFQDDEEDEDLQHEPSSTEATREEASAAQPVTEREAVTEQEPVNVQEPVTQAPVDEAPGEESPVGEDAAEDEAVEEVAAEEAAAEQSSDDQEDEVTTSAQRRAASVEEAASVKREASRSVRESAPFPAVQVDDEDEAEQDEEAAEEAEQAAEEGAADTEEAADEQAPSGRTRRVTEEISSVDDEPEPSAEESAEEEQSAEEEEAAVDEPTDQEAPAEEESAEEELAEEEAREVEDEAEEPEEDTEEIPELEIEPAEMPAAVERTATDRQVVKAEYDLSQSPGSKSPGSNPVAAKNQEDADDEAADHRESLEEETVDLVGSGEKAAKGEEEPDEEEAPAKEEAPAEEASAEDEEKPDEEEASAEEEEPDEEEEPAGEEKPADEKVEEETEETEEDEEDEKPAAAADAEDDFFESAVSDESHEQSFFQEGDEEEFDWEFEDVPKSSNRWMYFTAVAVLLALTALVITLATETESSSEKDGTDTVAEGDEQPAEQPDPTPVADKQPEEKIAENPEPPVEEPVGLNAEAATDFASQSAAGVAGTAQNTAMVLAGVDPSIMGEQADAGNTDAGTPDAGTQVAENGQPDTPANTVAANTQPDKSEPSKSEPSKSEPTKTEPAKQPAKSGNSFDDRLAKAARLVRSGRNSAALDLLRKLSAEKAGSGKTAYLHGQAALGVGNNSEAIKQLARADRLGYRKASMYLDLATAYQLSGDVDKAKGAYKKFLKIQPSGKRADEVRSILERL